jgi:hypothetical protein
MSNRTEALARAAADVKARREATTRHRNTRKDNGAPQQVGGKRAERRAVKPQVVTTNVFGKTSTSRTKSTRPLLGGFSR